MVIIDLWRSYFPNGTNGEVKFEGKTICFTIELPWKNNAIQKSCIPEGHYHLEKRYSKTFGWHLLVKDVPGRESILFHPANHALKELKGCIAPVSKLSQAGIGTGSRLAFESLKTLVYSILESDKSVLIHIKSI